MVVFTALAFALVSFLAPQQQSPFATCMTNPSPSSALITPEAAYPRGEPSCFTSFDSHGVGFLAQGASIEILDMRTLPTTPPPLTIPPTPPPKPPVIGSLIEIPEASIHAMMIARESASYQLVIAGGTQGLWKMDVCTSLWTSGTPCSSYAPVQVDDDCDKVCIDVVTMNHSY